jgi:hypothetical protein
VGGVDGIQGWSCLSGGGAEDSLLQTSLSELCTAPDAAPIYASSHVTMITHFEKGSFSRSKLEVVCRVYLIIIVVQFSGIISFLISRKPGIRPYGLSWTKQGVPLRYI